MKAPIKTERVSCSRQMSLFTYYAAAQKVLQNGRLCRILVKADGWKRFNLA
jgi:hypothetical protein